MSSSPDDSTHFTARDYAALALVTALAGWMLFWHLGGRALWQDEAATAVLAERMLEYGKPLAYDGRNLITMDVPSEGDTEPDALARRTGSAATAVAYYVERGDFKADTTWIGQPWGQFVLAAGSLGAFGHGTLQARLPFALCGLLTVIALWLFVLRWFNDRRLATLAALLLLANVYWVLHMRQCRYYAPAGLFFFLTVVTYLRWQSGRRYAAALFVATAWVWFQFDYGTFWPIVVILGSDSLLRRRRRVWQTLGAFAAIVLTVAPWVYYYELFARVKATVITLQFRALGLFFFYNQFLLPVVLLPVVGWVVWRARRSLRDDQRQAIEVALAIVASLLIWAPLVVPAPHLRYLVGAAPLASLLLAFVCVRVAEFFVRSESHSTGRTIVAAALAATLAITPWASNMALAVYPEEYWPVARVGTWLRAEWQIFIQDVGGMLRDPNGELVALLARRIRPDDEVLINYEDIPLMFYLDNPIRGGMAGFRVNDSSKPPPRFVVITESAEYLYSAALSNAFRSSISPHVWSRVPSDTPAYRTSHCPDPYLHPGQWGPEGHVMVLELNPAGRP